MSVINELRTFAKEKGYEVDVVRSAYFDLGYAITWGDRYTRVVVEPDDETSVHVKLQHKEVEGGDWLTVSGTCYVNHAEKALKAAKGLVKACVTPDEIA
jgi:hypothetical protein